MRFAVLMLSLALLVSCESKESSGDKPKSPAQPRNQQSSARAKELQAKAAKFPKLWDERADFETKLVRDGPDEGPAPVPPPDAPFELITYAAAPGPLAAYLSKDPGDGQRHPAIIWLTGGDTNSIGDIWSPAKPSNDQTAAAYREAGLVMMFPSQRGGNDNPGRREGFLGEVDDVIAAHAHLATVPYVDPQRIYLGGHSTGGTLAMLVAETTDVFRATFAFGPVHVSEAYGDDFLYCDTSDEKELALRAPIIWTNSIRTPTFVFEGSEGGNVDSLEAMDEVNPNPLLHFHVLVGLDHFSVLDPINRLIATKLIADVGPATNLAFDPDELSRVITP